MKILKEITKFLITGGLSAIITLVILNISLFFVPLFTASIIGYAGGIVNSFLLNKKWTFQFENQNKNTFIIFVFFNILVMILFGGLNITFFTVTNNKFISQIISIFITTVLNFSVYKYFIFKK